MTVAVERDIVLAAASVAVQAGEQSKPARVEIVAYSGGLMRVAGFGLIAIDLSGLEASGDRIPILSDHNAALEGILGHGMPATRDGRLTVSGEIVASGESAQRVLELAKSGFQFQASVGAVPVAERVLAAGESVSLNGRTITAPKGGATLITKARLKEVSILSLAADDQTSVHIAAQKMENDMITTVDEQKIRAEERARLQEIEGAIGELSKWGKDAGQVTELKAKAISGEITASQLNGKLLEIIRAARPTPPAIIHGDHTPTPKVLAAAVFCRLGLESVGEKHLGAQCMEQGRRMRGSHMLDLCRAALEAEGQVVPSGRMEMIRAALSTISLPVALGSVANKLLLDAYQETPPTWRSFAAIKSVSDFKTSTGVRPSLGGQLDQIAPGGELKHATMNEATFPYKIDSYGKMLTIDRRDLINDDLGVFLDSTRAFGQAARRKVSDLVYDILLTNGGGFFSAGNGNLLAGVDSALTPDGLTKAITAMAAQRDGEGNDLDIKPVTLVVPPELSVTAQQILKSEQLQRNPGEPTTNVLKGIVNLESEPRLSNTVKYKTKASMKHWLLFAAPSAAAMIVAFLDGNENPTVEFFGIESEPNRLAASWRVYHDFGAALGDPRAGVKSNGQ